ncbi:hypothetical protein HUG20_17175 [Salicibibacter cibi]|uniref:Lipoprotein n=1 Tax=Salicibibacter cibi TaxID=2743001 RepID=A0A7T6ZDM7_9BACI|nr:hypothetical protein [Salicibibacter cibi]QQK81472.1 hypothetical protein HUG20_17175 [Salicibibacter cibi]
MKKFLTIFSVVMIAGCSTDDVDESGSIEEDESGSVAENESTDETGSLGEADNSEGNEEVGESDQPFFENHRNEIPELNVVEEEIGRDFDEVNIQNDQGGSRVILYENDGIPEYKSIYIKNDERLKIINTNNQDDENGLIYEEIIG